MTSSKNQWGQRSKLGTSTLLNGWKPYNLGSKTQLWSQVTKMSRSSLHSLPWVSLGEKLRYSQRPQRRGVAPQDKKESGHPRIFWQNTGNFNLSSLQTELLVSWRRHIYGYNLSEWLNVFVLLAWEPITRKSQLMNVCVYVSCMGSEWVTECVCVCACWEEVILKFTADVHKSLMW